MAPIKQTQGEIPKYIGGDEKYLISSGTFSQTYKLKPMKITHKDAPFDHYMTEPDTSWFKPLIAVVIIVTVCWGIYVVTSLMSV